tara:strand:+ start:90 stop:356 length:267 start_codon:yes stop_codon:yes gene_type:complete
MANKIQNSIFEDMIEKLELFERKLNILEDLLYELRLNMKNKKDIENAKNSKTTDIIKKLNVPVKKRRKKKSIRLPFNNYVLDTESESE